MSRTVFDLAGYTSCPDHRIINRFTPILNSFVRFGYPRHDAVALPPVFAAVRSTNAEVHAGYVNAETEWAVGCPAYKDPSAECTCGETYIAGKSADAALHAKCFARGIFAHAAAGSQDKLVFLSGPVPFVAVRADRAAEYDRHRLGHRAKVKKGKRRRNRVAHLKKVADMRARYGIKPGPLYDSEEYQARRAAKLDAWVSDNKDGAYQLECWQAGIMQSIRMTDGRLIRRRKVTSGRSYKKSAAGDVFEEDSVQPARYKSGRRKGRIRSERMLPQTLKWCFKQFEIGAHKFCDFKFIAVMERGAQGGMFHYHALMHIYRTDLELSELEKQLRLLWYRITGNLVFNKKVPRKDEFGEPVVDVAGEPIVDEKSWFQLVDSAEEAAHYVSKYASKGWFSKRQTSKHLNLKDAARDSRLIGHGFLSGDVAQNFKRHEDGFLTYESPFTEEDIAGAGAREWVGLELTPLAPDNFPHFKRVDVIATFIASSPCKHPAAAIAGSCFDKDGNRLDVVPQARWFPFDIVVKGLVGTVNAEALRSELNRAHLKALRDVRRQRDTSDMSDAAAAAALFDGRFPFLAQREEMRDSLKSLPDQAHSAMFIVKSASQSYFAAAHAEALKPSPKVSERYLRLRSERREERARRHAASVERYALGLAARSP